MSNEQARILIIALSFLLGIAEWAIIRKTSVNKWILPLAVWLIAIVYTVAAGGSVLVLPSLFVALALAACAVEDLMRKRGKGPLSDLDKSRIRDL